MSTAATTTTIADSALDATKTYLEHYGQKEKSEAMRLGAKWDAVAKKLYAPNREPALLEKWGMRIEPVELLGEDREYGGNDLFVDLIPSSCWFNNVRTCVHPKEWNRLRAHVYARANHRCECCRAESPLEAHERWRFDEATDTQTLVRLVALCRECHQATHMGLARVQHKEKDARAHLQRVRGFTDEQLSDHVDAAFALFRKRSHRAWTLDLGLLERNGVVLKPIPDKTERAQIAANHPLIAARMEAQQDANTSVGPTNTKELVGGDQPADVDPLSTADVDPLSTAAVDPLTTNAAAAAVVRKRKPKAAPAVAPAVAPAAAPDAARLPAPDAARLPAPETAVSLPACEFYSAPRQEKNAAASSSSDPGLAADTTDSADKLITLAGVVLDKNAEGATLKRDKGPKRKTSKPAAAAEDAAVADAPKKRKVAATKVVAVPEPATSV